MPDMQSDVDGIVCRILNIKRRSPQVDRIEEACKADDAVISHILYSYDSSMWRANVLGHFKAYERAKAGEISAYNPGLSTNECWYEMQDRLAARIKSQNKLKSLM